jgi:hypothetical protein
MTESGEPSTFRARCETFELIAKRLADELSAIAPVVYHQHLGPLAEMTALASSMREAAVVLPPHPLEAFRQVVESLAGHRPIVMGINGGGDVIDANARAFNIGVHDPIGRLVAVDVLLESICGTRKVVFVGQPSRAERAYERSYALELPPGATATELFAPLERLLGRSSEDIVVLATTNALGVECVKALTHIDFRGTLVRERATSFSVPATIEVVDAMGSFRDLPTQAFSDLYRRAIGRDGSIDELSELMDLAWRLDAIQLIAEAQRASSDGDLLPGVRHFAGGAEVLQGLTRRISFDERGMNTCRGTVLVKRSRGRGVERLHERQVRPDRTCVPVAFISCEVTHLDLIDVPSRQFEAELEVELTSVAALDASALVFPSAVENPQVLLSGTRIRPRTHDSDPDLSVVRARIRGRFYFDPDVADYPFDEQRLPVRIEVRHEGQTLPIQPLQLPATPVRTPHEWTVQLRQEAQPLIRGVTLHPGRWPDGALEWTEHDHAVFVVEVQRRPTDGMMRALVPNAIAIAAGAMPGLLSLEGTDILLAGYGVLLGFFLTESRPIAGKLTRVDLMYLTSTVLLALKGVVALVAYKDDSRDATLDVASSALLLIAGLVAAGVFAWPILRAWIRRERS